MKRRLLPVTAAMMAVALIANGAVAAPSAVRTTGEERVVPNAMVQATLRFTPGKIGATSGDEVTWTDDDVQGAPHTATIVEEFPEPNARRGLRLWGADGTVRRSARCPSMFRPCGRRGRCRVQRPGRFAPVLRAGRIDQRGRDGRTGNHAQVSLRHPSLDAGRDHGSTSSNGSRKRSKAGRSTGGNRPVCLRGPWRAGTQERPGRLATRVSL